MLAVSAPATADSGHDAAAGSAFSGRTRVAIVTNLTHSAAAAAQTVDPRPRLFLDRVLCAAPGDE